MDNNGAIFINRTKDIVLAEHLSVEGRKALHNMGISMTEDELYDEIYVKPFSEYLKRENENVSSNDEPDSISYSDEIDINFLNNIESTFRIKLENLSESLFIIKGVAGTGKTTYMHMLKRYMKNSIQFCIHDFETVRQSEPFLSDAIDLKRLFSKNTYKFISTLLREISIILWKGNKSTELHQDYINNIINIYDTYIHVTEDRLSFSNLDYPNTDTEEQQDIFNIFREYSKKIVDYNTFTYNLKQKITLRLFSNETDACSDLAYISGFLIRLYFCLSRINKRKYLCVIDNIETFVKYDPEHPILITDLETIVEGCLEATRKARELLIPIQKDPSYNTFYGFLLVTRETTVSTALHNIEHNGDYRKENEIDISNWYCTDEIYQNKRAFFIKKGISVDSNNYDEAYSNILGDHSDYRWNLNGIISKMYKHSHRRNVECLPDALGIIPEREIQYFNIMWNKAREKKPIHSSLIALCRKYILRILLDHVQRKGYFDKLMVGTLAIDIRDRSLEKFNDIIKNDILGQENNSFARKISTILHRVSLMSHGDKYISFPRLIHSIFKRPNLPDEPTSSQIESLGKILFLMNETRNELTNWTSLICLKFSNKEKYNESNLCIILQKQWNNYKNKTITIDDTIEYGVAITEAGSFFARILPDFEYFACRYLSCEPALFSLENIKPIYIEGERIFKAIAIIRIVRAKAFACVEDVINKDIDFFAAPDISTGVLPDFSLMFKSEYSWVYKEIETDTLFIHPHRVLTQHRGYITSYIDYVNRFIPQNRFDRHEDKYFLLKLARKELFEYDNKLLTLQEKYPDYFKPINI